MIGYYAHGQGSGHLNYAKLFSAKLSDLIIFTDRVINDKKKFNVVQLPNEHLDGSEFNTNDYPAPPALHYAPVNNRKLLQRNSLILKAILERDVNFMIVDVSVEIAMLCRVSSIPYAYVRLPGKRSDLPHLNAFRGATFLLAYYPESMEAPDTLDWVREKTIYLDFISKYDNVRMKSPEPECFRNTSGTKILHITGFGGHDEIDYDFSGRKHRIFRLGPQNDLKRCSKTINLGVVPCIKPYIEHADVIIAACGLNLTSEIIALGKRFIAIEEERYFNEHQEMAKMLQLNNLAVRVFDRRLEAASKALQRGGFDKNDRVMKPSWFHKFCSQLSNPDFAPDLLLSYFKHLQRMPVSETSKNKLILTN